MASTREHSHHPPRDAPNRFLVEPLPRNSPPSDLKSPHRATDGSKYDLIIVGAGPSGSFLNLILARYGVDSVLCIDASATATQVGHADGIVPRTIEVLASFGLEHDVLRYGRLAAEQAVWKRQPASDGKPGRIVRESRKPIFYSGVNGRYTNGVCICMHQGHVERIFEDDLAQYTDRTVQRNTRLVSARLDDADTEYPVEATLQSTTDATTYQVRAKYLVGADGAHSAVRNSLGIRMEGDSTDDIFSVIDLVPQTDYPDVHRVGTIATDDGTILHIPREARGDGHQLIRLYVPLDTVDATAPSDDGGSVANGTATEPNPTNTNTNGLLSSNDKPPRRHDYSHITPATILARANALLHPYIITPHPSSPAIDWSTVYRVGQRVAAHLVWPPQSPAPSSSSPAPSTPTPRIFLIGDASHTHSPKVGQGLNVSLQDAHNLAWKLAHVLSGLVPAENAGSVLASYEAERMPVAKDLIELEKLWYSARYERVRAGVREEGKGAKEMGEADLAAMLGEMLSFMSGLNVEYPAAAAAAAGGGGEASRLTSILVDGGADGKGQEAFKDAAELAALKAGRLRVGRRLPEAECVRYADGVKVWLQSTCDGRGCWWVVVFAGEDLGEVSSTAASAVVNGDVGGGEHGNRGAGRSVAALEGLLAVQKRFVKGTVRSVVLHASEHLSFEWADLPGWMREEWETRLLGFEDAEKAYGMFGVEREKGRVALVRPDGYIAAMEDLSAEGVGRLEEFLGRVCVTGP